LRTPLTGIKWFSELLLKGKLPATTKDYVNQIIVSTERMVRLVDDLLNVSRIETGRKFDIILKHVDIVPVVKSVIQEQLPGAIEKKLELNCAANAPKELILSIDELKMRQVFQNLVNNAIKYSRENTTIEVGCDQTKKDEVTFYVRDHGVGIPQKQQVQVFNKFFRAENVMTLHTDGTGLGLYIAKAIVEAHHGKIWFESEENKGTTFFFTLPTKLVPETVVAEPKSDETPVANPVAVAKKIEK
jgi:signal transduction histidine kinase